MPVWQLWRSLAEVRGDRRCCRRDPHRSQHGQQLAVPTLHADGWGLHRRPRFTRKTCVAIAGGGEARVYPTPRRSGGSLSPSSPFSAFGAFLRRSLATCSCSPASCSTSLARASIAANIHSNRGFASELFNVIISSVGQAGYVRMMTSVGAFLFGAVVLQLAVVLLSLPSKSCAWVPTWTATAGTA